MRVFSWNGGDFIITYDEENMLIFEQHNSHLPITWGPYTPEDLISEVSYVTTEEVI